MSSPRRRIRALVLTVFAVAVALIGVKLFTGVGPDVPGPRLREILGFEEPFALCKPDPERVRHPSQPIAGTLRWRRAGVVAALANDEVRATSAGGLVYVGGGARPNDDGTVFASLDSFNAYDPTTGRTRRLPALPTPLDHTVFGTWRGQVYVFGGRSNGVPSDRSFRYSPRERRWTELARLPRPRLAGAGATIGDRFYFVGGALENRLDVPYPARDLFAYDFRSNTWTTGAPMRYGRHHVAAAATDGKLYVVGGRSPGDLSMSSVERYNPETDTWELLPPLPFGTGGLGAVSIAGRVVVIGGGDDQEQWVTPATWSFAPGQGEWTRLGDLNVPRHGFATAAVAGRIYVIGGSPCPLTGRTGSVEVSTGEPS